MVSVILGSSFDTSDIFIFTAIGNSPPLYIGIRENCVTDIFGGVIGMVSK